MSRSRIAALATGLLVASASAAAAGGTLYSAPLYLSDQDSFTCTVRNISSKEVVVKLRIVDFMGVVQTEGPEETLAPGRSTVRGIFASNEPRACEIDMIKGGKRAVRAAATVHGKLPDRRTTAAVEMR